MSQRESTTAIAIRGAERIRGAGGRPRRSGGTTQRVVVWASAVCVAFFVIAWAVPGLIAPTSPTQIFVGGPMEAPSLAHLLGTDELGRDLYSRVVHGASASLTMSVLVVLIGGVLGTAVGLVSGIAGGWVDEVLMRIVDLFLSLPGFVLALALAAAMGPGGFSVVLSLSLVWWPAYARLVRGMVVGLRSRLHVQAARTLGAGPARIGLVHMLPFVRGQLMARLTQDLGYALVNVAGLSFVGLGIEPPQPEWGALLQGGLQYVSTGWWLTFFPGLAITLWTVAVSVLGDQLGPDRRGGIGAANGGVGGPVARPRSRWALRAGAGRGER